jgi:hypothetical protein
MNSGSEFIGPLNGFALKIVLLRETMISGAVSPIPRVEMTAGKAMAQAAHAAQLGWRSLRRRRRGKWQEAGFPLAVRQGGERQWQAALTSGAPVVHDGGFTEVEPGTATAAFIAG